MDPTTVFCLNLACPARGQVGKGNIGVHSRQHKRFICTQCRKTFFSSPVQMGRPQRSGFSGRNLARCLRRSWHPSRYRQRLSVHRSEPWARPEGYRVADAMIKAR